MSKKFDLAKIKNTGKNALNPPFSAQSIVDGCFNCETGLHIKHFLDSIIPLDKAQKEEVLNLLDFYGVDFGYRRRLEILGVCNRELAEIMAEKLAQGGC